MNIQSSVLTYMIEGEDVWLGMKKRGYAEGKWNGFGGKTEKGETSEQAAIREIEEEAHVFVSADDLEEVAKFYYHETPKDWKVTIFLCRKWKGNLRESEEMRPMKFNRKKLPLKDMWENDALWVEKLITEGKKLKGTFWHDENDKVTKYELQEA